MAVVTWSMSGLLLLLAAVGLALVSLYASTWLRPQRIRRALRSQGIQGPPPSFPSGNVAEMNMIIASAHKVTSSGGGAGGETLINNHDYATTLFPHFLQWRKDYGQTFVFCMGSRAALYVSHPDLVREISLRVSLDLGKSTHLQKTQEPLFGHGILKSNGVEWAHQRRTIAPEFFMDKVKGMMELMAESAIPLMKSWEERIESQGGIADITVDEDLRSFSQDVISRACFGGSYSKGTEIFVKLRVLSRAIAVQRRIFELPYIRFLPTKNKQEIQRLEHEIRSLILDVVKERMEESRSSPEADLLCSILANADVGRVGSDVADRFVVDNCKNIYIAGQETTAVAMTWCLMLLAMHPDWQARARTEVTELFGGSSPLDPTNLIPKMKTLSMVIQETLRLYPPSPLVVRQTFQAMELGGVRLPEGIELWIPTSTMHHDPALWGPDADQFNPQRFARGVSGACRGPPHAYLPFGLGARTCVGQNFALVELKIVLSLLLSKFAFSLSPRYRHSPAFRMTIEPEFGLQLIVKKV